MKVKFITLGCKVNQYETQALMEAMEKAGFELTKGKADLYVVNTCSVTHRADAKSKEAVTRARRENPQAKVALCGCLVQGNGEKIKRFDVDYLIPQDRKQFLVEIIKGEEVLPEKRCIWDLKISHFFNHRAFVKVQDGCNNFCSFCKIPYLRGPSCSRNDNEVVEEIKCLLPHHPEIVLCGVNLGLYGEDLKPKKKLSFLIKKILDIKGLGRLRLSSLEPYLIDEELISLFSDKRLCPHLHLPFQSGDDKVLKLMNKRERISDYYRLVENLRTKYPDIAISCDIMVGFPAEDEESFERTVKFLEEIRPMRIHIFSFSPRERTKFEKFKVRNFSQVKRRLQVLKQKAEEFSFEYFRKFAGKTLYMVAEEREKGYTIGYTENYLRVHVKGNRELGSIYPVVIYESDAGEVKAKWRTA